MTTYVSTAIFEDSLRELFYEIVNIHRLIDGTPYADLSDLSSGEVTIVDAINDSYVKYRIMQTEVITIPTNCVWTVPEMLNIEGVLINDGLIIEV